MVFICAVGSRVLGLFPARVVGRPNHEESPSPERLMRSCAMALPPLVGVTEVICPKTMSLNHESR